ncbi:Sensor histidine kinase DesK [Streptomyces sp. YIM 130001]|uniref:sensor histidine kinase n=1 Tax=Streptomyces sp. YIM 130001 TaxID=2259644 RepID=UPI000E65E8CB|nr:sensor histidine kinase [Streptomyces sp. YIM 130001]RII09432.1 Sensor histidine kinase DesK [Streptomyces sp. YIM 130001]
MGWRRWTEWPTPEALSRVGVPKARMGLDLALRAGLALWLLLGAYHAHVLPGAGQIVVLGAVGTCIAAAAVFQRATQDNRLWLSCALLSVLGVVGLVGHLAGAYQPAVLLWMSVAVLAMSRMPPIAGVVAQLLLLVGLLAVTRDGLGEVLLSAGAVALIGVTLRVDEQARGAGYRLLAQEREIRAAETMAAALGERARIAREIHDVLAHSLSAQTVHLEAARLLIERDAGREQILERVVAARVMAREGLAETRQALSALRGEMIPVDEYLREIAAMDGARVEVAGEPRSLEAEVSQALRRVAQEALTNARRHAPGARIEVRLGYEHSEVTLEVRDSGRTREAAPPGESGSGYGLLGMRERAELLGGALRAEPEGEGFVVRLRVPA